jgi:hypothetical protein
MWNRQIKQIVEKVIMSHIVHDSWRALAEENLQWMEK